MPPHGHPNEEDNTVVRVATYTRISTDEEHQPYSLEAQDGRLQSYIDSQPRWQRVGAFVDQMSGAKLDRPGLTNALRSAKAGRFDLLLVYRVDRLSRSVRGLAQILEDLDGARVAFRSATEPFDTSSAAGRMMVQMLGVFAEFERATIIDRVIAGMERKAARGGWCGGQTPFGYQVRDGDLVVDTGEAALVPEIFRLYAHRRLGTRAIAAELNKHGRRSRNGRPWSHMTVMTILRNRTYVGEVFFRDTWHEGSHKPLVDREVFARVEAILVERGTDISKRASNSSDYLLTGLIVCNHYVGTAARGRSARYRYYTCFSRQRYGNGACRADRLPADRLDDAVLQSLIDTYGDELLIEEAIKAAVTKVAIGSKQREAELQAVDTEPRKTEDTIERYLLAFETGTLTDVQCGERLESLSSRAAELRSRKDAVLDMQDGRTICQPSDNALTALRQRIADEVRCGDTMRKKAPVQALVHELRVEGNTSSTRC